MLDRVFGLSARGTTAGTELAAGLTVFLTMSYIIFLQPAILSGQLFGMDTGLDPGAVMTATCVSAAIASIIMGIYARYPIAQAPGMGENFFLVFSVIPAAATLASVRAGATTAWQVALGAVFVSGVLFLVISLLGVRSRLIGALSPAMKAGIGAGIGLFIAFIGMRNSGMILSDPGTGVKLNADFSNPDIWIFLSGLFTTGALIARKVRGGIFWGIVTTTLISIAARLILPEQAVAGTMLEAFHPSARVLSAPPSMAPTFMKMDLMGTLNLTMLPFIIVLLFMDVFDTLGTLVGVASRAGLMKDGKLPGVEKALVSDAVGTVVGAVAGTSTVTSFIESAAGVEQGGRTGLTAVTAGVLFLAALFFAPLFAMVGGYPVITAPALVTVGALMIQGIAGIDWKDFSEALPAFFTMIAIPFTYSIGDGLAVGFISYPLVKLLSGRGGQVGWLMYLMAVVLLFYFVIVRGGLA
jgi:AGZA family xanthine/uracil permease-like MFS transporter